MSFTNPNETWDEFDARVAANRQAGIASESNPARRSRLVAADLMADVAAQFGKVFEKEPGHD